MNRIVIGLFWSVLFAGGALGAGGGGGGGGGGSSPVSLSCGSNTNIKLNEFNPQDGWSEVYVTGSGVALSGWKLQLSSNNAAPTTINLGGGSGCINSDTSTCSPRDNSASAFSSPTFITFADSVSSNKNSQAVLLAPDGTVADMVTFNTGSTCSYTGTYWADPGSCNTCISDHSASIKDYYRVTDGSGSWGNSGPGNSSGTANGTPGSSNVGTPSLHHLEIVHNGSGVTCQPATVTVKACANAACSSLYSGGVTANLTPGNLAVSIGSSGIATGSIVQGTAATVTLASNTVSPSPASATTCTNSANGSASCSMTFTSSGFLVTVPNHAACSNQTVTIQAPSACTTAFSNVTRNVSLYSTYVTPATGTRQAHVTYNTTQTVPALSTSAAAPSTLTALSFDGTGTALLTLSYPDVGQVTLTAGYSGSAATGDSGVSMTGSGTYIAAPASFAVSNTPASYVAGLGFAVDVTARTATGNACASTMAAPNFGLEGEGVGFASATRLTPAGTANALTGPSDGTWVSGTAGSYSTGKTTLSNNAWSEVGTLQVAAQVADGDYLGAGSSLTGATNVSFGPFRPAYFDTALTAGCGSFTYAAQPVAATVTARNQSGGTTLNYSYLAGAGMAKTVTLSNAGSTSGLSNNSITPSGFAAGIGTQASFAWTATTSPSAPATLTLRAVDTDGVTSQGHTEGSTEMRTGRARLLNAHGSEILDLNVPFTVEYWNGSYWTKNTADTCTGNTASSAANAVSVSLSNGTLAAAKTCIYDSGTPGLSGAGCTAAGPTSPQYKRFREGATPSVGFAGDFNLWLQKPGSGNSGSVRLSATVPDWLKYNWSGSVSGPSGLATFGVYRSGAVIHQREMY